MTFDGDSVTADFVAAVNETKVGDWRSRRKHPSCFKPLVGKTSDTARQSNVAADGATSFWTTSFAPTI
jgi:hypothetical protein